MNNQNFLKTMKVFDTSYLIIGKAYKLGVYENQTKKYIDCILLDVSPLEMKLILINTERKYAYPDSSPKVIEKTYSLSEFVRDSRPLEILSLFSMDEVNKKMLEKQKLLNEKLMS